MSKAYIIKRLRWYYPLEKFNAFVFSGLIIYVIIKYGLINTLFLAYGVFLMTVILFQGQHYWKLKLYRMTNKYFDQQKSIIKFKQWKRLNFILMGCIPIILVIQLLLINWTIKPENLFGWAVIANLFGVLEHINYYNRQLMIDNASDWKYLIRNKRLKIASLKKDLDENEI
jgi:hypothetical protein